MKIEFGVEDWSDGTCRPIHEAVLEREPRWIERQETIEGYVRLVTEGQPELQIRDDLWALLLNLGLRAAERCLGPTGAASGPRFEWLLTTRPRTVLLIATPDQVTLTAEGATATFPARAFWPAAVGAAHRFVELVARVRGPDHPKVRYLREPLARALSLLAERGWSLPDRPAPDLPASGSAAGSGTGPGVWWGRVDLYARRIEPARVFYREVLGVAFDRVRVLPADGPVGPPQWVGVIEGRDPGALSEALVERGGVELAADNTRRVWMDPWGALVGGDAEVGAGPPLAVAGRELRTADPAGAAHLYAGWLGWTAEPDPRGWRLRADGREVGVVRLADPGEGPRWVHFFAVGDVERAVARAVGSGAAVVHRGPEGVRLRDPYEGEFGLAL